MGQEEAIAAKLPAGGTTWGSTSVVNLPSSSNPCSWLCEQKPLLDLGQEPVDVNVYWINELCLTDGIFWMFFSYQEPLSSTNLRQV